MDGQIVYDNDAERVDDIVCGREREVTRHLSIAADVPGIGRIVETMCDVCFSSTMWSVDNPIVWIRS